MENTKTIVIPTTPEVSFLVDSSVQIPELGKIFVLRFEDYITDDQDWELALSTLENDVMVVDRVEGNQDYLREGI